jgi:hypothetical protein
MPNYPVREGLPDSRMVMNRVADLGGTPLDDRHFEIRLDDTRKIIGEVNAMGFQCDEVSQRQGQDLNRHACGYVTVKISAPPPKTEYDDQRNLMMVATNNKW